MVNFLSGVTIKKLDSEVYLEPSQNFYDGGFFFVKMVSG